MNDHRLSLNKHCTCQQVQCAIRGNCVLCVQNHLDHKRHIPECMQDILRPAIEALAAQVELKTTEARPDGAHWQRVDKGALVERSLKRHEAGEHCLHKRMGSKKAQADGIAAAAERYRRLSDGS